MSAKPKMARVMAIMLLGASVALSDRPPCEYPDDPLTFSYVCISQEVPLCIQGRHLKVAQPDCSGPVNENEICISCESGTFMDKNNYCNTCKPWTDCGPLETEAPDSPRSATKDRTCVPRPPQTVTPSECPPCEIITTPLTCPACPVCLTTDAQSTVNTLEEMSTSYQPGVDTTQPQNSTLCPVASLGQHFSGQKQELQNERDKWRDIAAFFIGLFITAVVFIIILIIAFCLRRGDHRVCYKCVPREHHDGCVKYKAKDYGKLRNGRANSRNEYCGPEQQGSDLEECGSGQQNSHECTVQMLRDTDVCIELSVELPEEQVQSSKEASLNSNNPPAENLTGQTPADDSPSKSKPPSLADRENSQDKASHLRSQEEQGSHNNHRVDRPGVSTPRPSEPPRVKKEYDVKENTKSMQPLLASENRSLRGNSMPTNAFQQSVPPYHNPEPTMNGEAIHNAPTALFQSTVQSSLYSEKSLGAFDKAEGQCSIVTDCSEWHLDFVKDEINVEKYMDFFAKLGVSNKRIKVTKINHQSDGIEEQIRHVLIDDFLGRSEDVSIKKLLSALDESGNKDVTREFVTKFQVRCL